MQTPSQNISLDTKVTTGNACSILDQAGDQVVLLAGAGRSGTTWVQELINYRQDHRVLFEPFWPEMVNFLPPQPSTHLYLRPDDPAPYFQPHAMRILRGEFYTPWTDRTNAPGVYQRRLIKDVRANLLLKWLTTQAPSLKVVLLLRHPCAVSLSQLRTGWPSNLASQLRELTMQPALFADFLNPFVPLLEATDSAFEANVLLWAIQNYVPLKQFGLHPADLGPATGVQSPQAQILPLFYERLCTDPEAELARLFDFLELPLEPEIFAVLRKPSLTAVGAPTEIAGEAMFDAWRGKVSPPQLERALAILHHFGLDQVYNEAAMPCSAQTNGGVPFAEKAGLTPPARNGAGAETQNLISPVLPAAELDFQPTKTRPTAQGCTKQTARCSAWMRQVGGTRPACCTEHLTELLFGAADLLAEYGIVHWIDCGALLGAVRQQVLMPWDHAAHMAFVDTEPSLIPFLVQSFQDAGYDVQYSPSMPDDIKVNFSATNHLHLNLYAYHRTVDGALRMSGIHTPAHWVFPASFIETMAPVTLYDRHFPAPSPVHDFLVNHRYGPGYQLVDTMQEGYYDKQISNAVD